LEELGPPSEPVNAPTAGAFLFILAGHTLYSKGMTVFTAGLPNHQRRVVSRLKIKKFTAVGKLLFPGYIEVLALETVNPLLGHLVRPFLPPFSCNTFSSSSLLSCCI
jgi:hypothetical protein